MAGAAARVAGSLMVRRARRYQCMASSGLRRSSSRTHWINRYCSVGDARRFHGCVRRRELPGAGADDFQFQTEGDRVERGAAVFAEMSDGQAEQFGLLIDEKSVADMSTGSTDFIADQATVAFTETLSVAPGTSRTRARRWLSAASAPMRLDSCPAGGEILDLAGSAFHVPSIARQHVEAIRRRASPRCA